MRRLLIVLVSCALLAGPLASHARAETYAETPTPTWVPNNGVLAMAVTTTRIYLAGEFTSLRNPFTGATVARSHLAAIDRATGRPVSTWLPEVTGISGLGAPRITALEVGPDGTLLVGGVFGAINGDPDSSYLAAVRASGAVDERFEAVVDGAVTDIAREGDDLYIAGDFTEVNGTTRLHVARLDAITGEVDATWDPNITDAQVRQLAVAEDQVYLAGRAVTDRSLEGRWLRSVDKSTGSLSGWVPSFGCPGVHSLESQYCSIRDLVVDEDRVYLAIGMGESGMIAAWNIAPWDSAASTVETLWATVTSRDVHTLAVFDGQLYAGGKFDYLKEDDGQARGIWRSDVATLNPADGSVLPHRIAVTSPFAKAVNDLYADATGLYLAGNVRTTGSLFAYFVVLPARGQTVPGPVEPLTAVKIKLKGCKKCKVRLTQSSAAETLWTSGWKRAKRGVVKFSVVRSQTIGMTVSVRAPWERKYRKTTAVVMRYEGKAVGSTVRPAAAAKANKASACFAGTDSTKLKWTVAVTRVASGQKVWPRAWVRKTQDFSAPMRKAPRGVLGSRRPRVEP